MEFSIYKFFTSELRFKVKAENKRKAMVFTLLEDNEFIRSAHKVRMWILIKYSPPYSRLDVKRKEDRVKLSQHFKEEIQKKKEEIKKLEMLVKIADRNTIELIKP